jgi:hypothetical protein
MIDFPELVSDRTTRVEVRVGEEAQPSVRSIPTAPIRASMLLSGIKGGRRNRFARQPLRRRGDGRLIRLWFSGLPIAAFPVFGHKVSPLRLIDRRGRRKIKALQRAIVAGRLAANYAVPLPSRRHIGVRPLLATPDGDGLSTSGATGKHSGRGRDRKAASAFRANVQAVMLQRRPSKSRLC